LEKLSPDDQAQAEVACEQIAQALWNTLTGIHEKTCLN